MKALVGAFNQKKALEVKSSFVASSNVCSGNNMTMICHPILPTLHSQVHGGMSSIVLSCQSSQSTMMRVGALFACWLCDAEAVNTDHHQTSKLAFYIALVLASGQPKD